MRPPPSSPARRRRGKGIQEGRAKSAPRHPSWIPFPALRAAGNGAWQTEKNPTTLVTLWSTEGRLQREDVDQGRRPPKAGLTTRFEAADGRQGPTSEARRG